LKESFDAQTIAECGTPTGFQERCRSTSRRSSTPRQALLFVITLIIIYRPLRRFFWLLLKIMLAIVIGGLGAGF
jgi:hypothetical protein